MKKALIVGAGISGISMSRLLSGKMEVTVLEKAAKSGGLIKCDRVDGALFHRVGGHVFNSKNQIVLEWFWKHFDRDNEFIKARRNAKILMEDQFIGYPLENYLYQLPENKIRSIVEDLTVLIAEKKQPADAENFKDFLLTSFGKTLFEIYFEPYNSKIWNTDISKVPLEWLEGKLPMPSTKEILINNILRKEESEMVHASFYYPKSNGSQFIINRLSDMQDIQLNYEVKSIAQIQDGRLLVNNEKEADYLIYCGDVRILHSIIATGDMNLRAALESVTSFASNGTSNVLCETDSNDISWLYLPEAKYKAHRIIYTGNFSESNNSVGRRKTCVVEFSGRQPEADMIKELASLPGNLVPIAFNYEPNSYIIHDSSTAKKIAALKLILRKYNIFLLGRFAEWEYYNMDKCVEKAMELSLEINN